MTSAAKKLSGYVLAAMLCLVLSGVALAQGTVSNDAFFVLCARGTVQEVGKALASGADIGARDAQGMTALMHAARNPDHRVVTLLLAAGAKPNVKNLQGETALMMVVENNSPEVVKFLLDAGVDVNAKNQDGVTALMRAAAENANPEVVNMLLAAGAKVNARDREKRTALMWAANGKSGPETVRVLLNAGAHVNARSGNDATALMYAVQNSNVEIVQILLDSGAKANLADVNGMAPLMVASKSRFVEMARLLLKSGADANARDKDGATALIWAAANNSGPEMMRALLDAGADVNAKTTTGATALMWAAHECEFEVVKILLDAKADVQASDNADHNALWYARNRKNANDKIVELLEKLDRPTMHSFKYIALFVLLACIAAIVLLASTRIEPVRQFFERLSDKPLIRKCSTFVHRCIKRVKTSFMREPASVGEQDPSGKSSSDETFLTLCQKGTAEEVEQPLDTGVDGSSSLIKAVRGNQIAPLIAALIQDGADVNCKDERGMTPLMWAVTNSSLEVVKMLLGAGAKVDEREDGLGRTALMLAVAVEEADPKIVETLLEAGANVNAKDRYECTAEKYARNRDRVNWQIVQMLEERHERSSSEILRQIVQDELVLRMSQANTGNEGGGDYIGRITDEFNGPLLSFGEKFWDYVRDRSQKARELLTNASIKIVSVEYIDRFLCSPLACSLLCMIIVGLRDSVGLEKFNNVHIDISTQSNHNSRNTAQYIWENWQNGKVMDRVLAGILGSFGINIIMNETENHDRWLYVGFSSGEKLCVSLGSGVSYWKMNRVSEGYLFDFTAQPSEQIERLKNIIGNPQNYIMGKSQEGTNFNIKIQ